MAFAETLRVEGVRRGSHRLPGTGLEEWSSELTKDTERENGPLGIGA
jgi:hypothetical protein